jgi:hypothetical protein
MRAIAADFAQRGPGRQSNIPVPSEKKVCEMGWKC